MGILGFDFVDLKATFFVIIGNVKYSGNATNSGFEDTAELIKMQIYSRYHVVAGSIFKKCIAHLIWRTNSTFTKKPVCYT